MRNILPKNSLMLLHEYRPNVEYRFVCQSGPIHRPMFTMCVDINEHKFEGTGKTKKDARMQAAEKTLEFLIQHPEYIQKAVPATDAEKNSKRLHNDNGENEDDLENLENSEANGLDGDVNENKEDGNTEQMAKRLKKTNSENDYTSVEAEVNLNESDEQKYQEDLESTTTAEQHATIIEVKEVTNSS